MSVRTMRFFNRALVAGSDQTTSSSWASCWALIGRNAVLPNTHFDLAHMLQSHVPAALKFRGDESVLRIGRIVLPLRTLGSIAGSLKIGL